MIAAIEPWEMSRFEHHKGSEGEALEDKISLSVAELDAFSLSHWERILLYLVKGDAIGSVSPTIINLFTGAGRD